jgi:phosphomannomutase
MGYHEMPPLALYYFVAELKNYTNAESMLQHCQIYHKSPVISIKDVDKEKAIAIVKKSYAQYPQETIDGISVFADNFRFNLRASNTENKIKFTLEADDLETMNKEKQKLETLLKNIK